MFKKNAGRLTATVLCLALAASCLVACGEEAPTSYGFDEVKELAAEGVVKATIDDITVTGDPAEIKIGLIMVGDETEGYTEAHMTGIRAAFKVLGIDEATQAVWKLKVEENEDCYNAAIECVAAGCNVIISNSYGHQDYMKKAATENPGVQFVAMTGDTAAASELPNFNNAFTSVYESRYVGGVVAGLKLKELIDAGKLTKKNYDKKGNVLIGYVGAYNYAEVVSGYTAFYLGIKSVVPNVVMKIQYTNSWFNWNAEYTTAKALMDMGCCMLGQHADSTGAPTAVQEYQNADKVVYCVGYNVDMLGVAPTAALTSAANNWASYYTYAFGLAINKQNIPTNWTGGYAEGAVCVTALGASCAAGTEAKVNETIANLRSGKLHVFDTSTFTIGGKTVTYAYASDTDMDWVADANNVIADGYFHESYAQSAPAFGLRIDGITELN